MLQRRQVLLRTSLKVKGSNFDHVAAQFATVSPEAVHIVSERIANGDSHTATLAANEGGECNKCPRIWIISVEVGYEKSNTWVDD
jgi:hypothetical protein